MNSIASALDYGTRLLVSFFVKPILVTGLGAYGFGAWEILGRLAGYLGPATGRAGHALRWTTAHQQASTDYESKRHDVGSAVIVWLLLTPVFCLLAGALAWLAPYWLEAPTELIWPVRITALLLGANVALSSLVDIPRAVLEGENLGYKRMGASALLVGIGGVATAAAVWLDLGLIGVAAATMLTSAVTGIFFLQVVRAHVPWFGVARSSWRSAWRFFRLTGWTLAWDAVERLLRASDVVVLGLLATVESVAVYSLTRYAPETAINLVAIVVMGVIPGLGGIIGAGDLRKASRVRAEIMALTWLIATIAGATTLLWNRSFLQLWVGQNFDAGSRTTLLMVVMVTQYVLFRSDSNVINLTLNLRGKVLLGFVSTVTALALAGILVGPLALGIDGLCLGIIAGRMMLSVGYPWIVGRFLGLSLSSQLQSAIRPCLVSAVLYYLAMQVGAHWVVTDWAKLVLSVGLSLLLLPLPVFFIGLDRDLRVRLWQRLHSITRSNTAVRSAS